jgi:hypothetical protein
MILSLQVLLDLHMEQLQSQKQNLLFTIILPQDIFGIGQTNTKKILVQTKE